MKIALIHYSAPPIVGGVESVIAQHARLFAQAGHDVSIIAGRGAAFDPAIELKIIPLIDSRHPQVTVVKSLLDQGIAGEEFSRLKAQIATELALSLSGVDVLIAHNVCSLNKNLALTAALHDLTQKHGAPRLILWHHDLAWTTPRYRDELHAGVPWDLLRKDWPWARQVVVSAMRRDELSHLYQVPFERMKVIPNGVNPVKFHKLDARTAGFYRQLRLGHASPLLLMPVRITPRKNIELGLRTLSVLIQTFPDAKMVITGPLGPHNAANHAYFQQLNALRAELRLQDRAFFLAEWTEDFLPDSVISDFYHLADALFFPSREEGFGIPVLEAGLAGIPAVCAAIEPLRTLGGAYVTYFSPDADPSEVAALLGDLFEHNPVFRLRQQVLREYTWEQIFERHIAPLVAQ